MAIKPILVGDTEMVRAILEGRKSCIRRIVKGKILWGDTVGYTGFIPAETISGFYMLPYQVGDILYIRETWHKYTKRIGKGEECHLAEFYGYKASVANYEDAHEAWKSPASMPKEAARIFLKVTDVRLGQLQEITVDDIRNEGLSSMAVHAGDIEIALKEWKKLWNSTIKKPDLKRYGWDANPGVWVIEFERCEKPEGV